MIVRLASALLPRRLRRLRWALPLAAPLLLGQTAPDPSALQLILTTHNDARVQVGLPPLVWSAELARDAQDRAEALARAGQLFHAGRQSRSGNGENLWAGTRGRYSPDEMVNAWVAERRYFRPGRFPDNSTTGNWTTVAHYTQVVWRRTGEIGCGIADDARYDYLVCRYRQPGNIVGETPY